jgi:predicted unusual protein kinase regulating ubiquinone biosynthesis (AarF/ABC1/UbiB family)
MKLGQSVWFLDHLLSADERLALVKIREGARPMSTTALFRTFRETFGAKPQQLFAEWSSVPIRRGSVGQVHRARTKDGRHVAVKVQYPSIRQAIENDFELARMFQGWLDALWPVQRREIVFAEMSERFLEECDYEHEARATKAFKAAWRDEPRISIPEVIEEVTRGPILTTSWLPGLRWEEFLARPGDRVAAAETIWDFYIGSLFRHGMFNADPHPGNVLFDASGLAFVDFGRVKSFTPEFHTYFLEVSRAICAREWGRVHQLSVDAGLISPSLPLLELARHCCWLWLPMLVDSIRFSRTLCRASIDSLKRGSRHETMSMDHNSVFLHHLHLGVYSMLAQLDVTVDYRRRFLPLIYPSGGAPAAFDRAELSMLGVESTDERYAQGTSDDGWLSACRTR